MTISEASAPFMHAADVDKNDDFAFALVGVDRLAGLYVLDEAGNEVRISLEVQQQVHEALGDYLESVS